MTQIFNEFSIDERTALLDMLPDADREKFIDNIRKQAVKDFWTHERMLIENGRCTRDWSPWQIEYILNISEETGMKRNIGGVTFDSNGRIYYSHRMANVSDYPEYAGDWRLIQPLTFVEHYFGAYDDTMKNPGVFYYNPETCQRQPITLQ